MVIHSKMKIVKGKMIWKLYGQSLVVAHTVNTLSAMKNRL